MDRRGRQGRLRGPVNIGMGKPVAIGEVMFVCANPHLLRSSTD